MANPGPQKKVDLKGAAPAQAANGIGASGIGATRRLPPLNALRAFEAAARLGSLKKASEELHVTPGAVSRQVALLENDIKAKLFKRQHRRVTLTAVGAAYLEDVRIAFDQISRATARATTRLDDRELKLRSPPTFAIRWLVPRLANFHAEEQNISVQITTSHDPADFDHDDCNAAVQWSASIDPALEKHLLFEDMLFPICSADFPRPDGGFTLQSLSEQSLLDSIQRPLDWAQWFKAAGATEFELKRPMTFQSSTLTYQAALEGLGIALGQPAFCWDELKSGRLVAAYPRKVIGNSGYYLTYPKESRNLKKLRALRSWISREARTTRLRQQSEEWFR